MRGDGGLDVIVALAHHPTLPILATGGLEKVSQSRTLYPWPLTLSSFPMLGLPYLTTQELEADHRVERASAG